MSNPYPVRFLTQTKTGGTILRKIAYRHTAHNTSMHKSGMPAAAGPGILFCGGFHSNMDGGKAEFLHTHCQDSGIAFTRFDYSGHGKSSGQFIDGTIGDWYLDARAILESVCHGRQVVVGSSMGAWMALLLARDRPDRVAGLVLIAPAPDFPQRLMLPSLPDAARRSLARDGVWYRPSEFEAEPYPITRRLIEESRHHEVLSGPSIQVLGAVHILHGTADEVVPLSHAQAVADWVGADTVTLETVEGGDHRLSTPADLDRLWAALHSVMKASR